MISPAPSRPCNKVSPEFPARGRLYGAWDWFRCFEAIPNRQASALERAVDLLPEWAGSYSTLGVFYYQTGQIEKAREVLNRFKGSSAGGLDVSRIEEALVQGLQPTRSQRVSQFPMSRPATVASVSAAHCGPELVRITGRKVIRNADAPHVPHHCHRIMGKLTTAKRTLMLFVFSAHTPGFHWNRRNAHLPERVCIPVRFRHHHPRALHRRP